MATTALKTASVLAFERKLDPSDALFASGSWALRDQASTWPAITVREKSVRGTISNRLKSAKDADPAKLDAAIKSVIDDGTVKTLALKWFHVDTTPTP